MAASIATLAVSITANLRGLSSGISRAVGMVGGFAARVGAVTGVTKLFSAAGSALSSVFSGFFSLAGAGFNLITSLISGAVSAVGTLLGFVTRLATGIAAIGTVAATAFAVIVKQSINTADNIRDLSIRTGISTRALSELQHVANLTGVSFESIVTAVSRSQRVLVEASQSAKKMDEFRSFGVNVNQILKLAPEEQFEALGAAIAGIANPARRTALAMELFGRGGAELIQTFADGPDALFKMRREARLLGLSIGQRQADDADRFNDAMTTIKGGVVGVARQLSLTIAGPLSRFAAAIAERIPQAISSFLPKIASLQPAIANFFTGLTEGIPKAISFIGKAFDQVGPFVGKVKDWFVGLVPSIGDVFTRVKDTVLNAVNFIVRVFPLVRSVFRNVLSGVVSAFEVIVPLLPTFAQIGKFITNGLSGANNFIAQFANTIRTELPPVVEMIKGVIADLPALVERVGAVIDQFTPRLEQVAAIIDRVGGVGKVLALPGKAIGATVASGAEILRGETTGNIGKEFAADVKSAFKQAFGGDSKAVGGGKDQVDEQKRTNEILQGVWVTLRESNRDVVAVAQ